MIVLNLTSSCHSSRARANHGKNYPDHKSYMKKIILESGINTINLIWITVYGCNRMIRIIVQISLLPCITRKVATSFLRPDRFSKSSNSKVLNHFFARYLFWSNFLNFWLKNTIINTPKTNENWTFLRLYGKYCFFTSIRHFYK